MSLLADPSLARRKQQDYTEVKSTTSWDIPDDLLLFNLLGAMNAVSGNFHQDKVKSAQTSAHGSLVCKQMCRTLTHWTLGMYLSTEMNQGLN